MRKYPAGILVFAATLVFILSYNAYAADSGCVNCHTNAKMLSALHKPVKVDLSEGVG